MTTDDAGNNNNTNSNRLDQAMSEIKSQLVTEYILYEYLNIRLDRQVKIVKDMMKKGRR